MINCSEKCGGKIDMATSVNLMIGCGGCCGAHSLAHPCNKCGRLHWESGNPVFNRAGKRAFLEGGRLVNKPAIVGEPAVPECRMHGSIEHMQSATGECPECGKP